MNMRFRHLFAYWLALTWLAPATGRAGETIKVITYNVQFLPGIAAVANKRPNPNYRAERIGQALADYDVIGLNEAFDAGPRSILLDQIKAAWGAEFAAVVHPKPNDNRVNGGLVIVSRFPILETNSTYYSKASSPKEYGFRADGFAAKGVLHARLWRGGSAPKSDALDVFITHLEAADDRLRPLQYRELADFVAAHADPARPAIIMGDMNTRGSDADRADSKSRYNLLRTRLNRSRPNAELIDLWPFLESGPGGTSDQERADGGKRIDYIFVSNPAAGLVPRGVRVNRFLDPKVVALSDHSAVEADLDWPAPSP